MRSTRHIKAQDMYFYDNTYYFGTWTYSSIHPGCQFMKKSILNYIQNQGNPRKIMIFGDFYGFWKFKIDLVNKCWLSVDQNFFLRHKLDQVPPTQIFWAYLKKVRGNITMSMAAYETATFSRICFAGSKHTQVMSNILWRGWFWSSLKSGI